MPDVITVMARAILAEMIREECGMEDWRPLAKSAEQIGHDYWKMAHRYALVAARVMTEGAYDA